MRKAFRLFAVVLTAFLSGCVVVNDDLPARTLGELSAESRPSAPCELCLKEQGEYQHYLVFRRYGEGILLLRKEVLDEPVQFAAQSVSGTGANYYSESIPDRYLNEQFLNVYSESVKQLIPLCDVEIASLETIQRSKPIRETETIQRKIFLMSAAEMDISSSMCAKEGKTIQGLKGQMTEKSQWLRSAFLWDEVRAWAVNTESVGAENVTEKLYLRPALTLPSDLAVHPLHDGKEQDVYVLDCDSE